MAEKKGNTKQQNSGFNGQTIGEMFPKGTTFKRNANGTLTPVYPKSGTKNQSKKK